MKKRVFHVAFLVGVLTVLIFWVRNSSFFSQSPPAPPFSPPQPSPSSTGTAPPQPQASPSSQVQSARCQGCVKGSDEKFHCAVCTPAGSGNVKGWNFPPNGAMEMWVKVTWDKKDQKSTPEDTHTFFSMGGGSAKGVQSPGTKASSPPLAQNPPLPSPPLRPPQPPPPSTGIVSPPNKYFKRKPSK